MSNYWWQASCCGNNFGLRLGKIKPAHGITVYNVSVWELGWKCFMTQKLFHWFPITGLKACSFSSSISLQLKSATLQKHSPVFIDKRQVKELYTCPFKPVMCATTLHFKAKWAQLKVWKTSGKVVNFCWCVEFKFK